MSFTQEKHMDEELKEENIFTIIHKRRSIRKFLDKEISNEVMTEILSASFRAPFAYQACSIVYTLDKKKMDQLKSMGVYPTTKVLMFFFIDFNRMEKIVKARKHTYDFDDSLFLWLGIQDVSLASENLILAAEAFGLGSVLLGGAPLFVNLISEIFHTPPKVFPVVGLCLGYPDPKHVMDIRPRFPLKYSAYEDTYQELSMQQLKECIQAMDEGYLTQGYYIKQNVKIPLKKGKDNIDFDKYSWTEHISRKISQGAWSEETLLNLLRKQGFNLE